MKFTNFGKKLLAFVAVAVLGLILVSCGGGNKEKEQHQANVNAVLEAINFDDTQCEGVVHNLIFVKQNAKYPDVKIEWISNEPDVISADGKVTRPYLDDPRIKEGTDYIEVTVTVKASQGEAEGSEKFVFQVVGEQRLDKNNAQALKKSFYTWMQSEGLKYNAKTYENPITAELTGEVIIKFACSYGGTCFFINDGVGVIYVYNKTNTYDIAVGDIVKVSGDVYASYGLVEFSNPSVVEKVADKEIAAPVFEETTISEYTAALDAALDNNGKIVDVDAFLPFSCGAFKLYAKVEKGNKGSGDTYYLADPYTGQSVAIYHYTTVDHVATLDALEGKYVYANVYAYDTHSSLEDRYRVVWDGSEMVEAPAPELSDAQKVATTLAGLALDAKVTEDVTLPVVEGVVWSLKEEYAAAKIENGVLKVTRPENGKGNATVVVVATATVGTATDSKEISVEVVEKEDSGIKEVTEFEAEKAYKLGLFQETLSKQLWLTGEISGRYASTTENPAEAADVKVVTVEGGYQLVVAGKYLEFANNAEGKISVVLLDAPTAAWTYDAEHNTFLFVYSETTYFLGTYSNFNTLSASAKKYIDSGNFISHLYEVAGTTQPEQPEQPEQPGEEIVSYTINKAMPTGLTYITNNASYPNPEFYSNAGGLKMRYVNQGVQTAAFAAQNSVVVTFTIAALNENTKSGTDADCFTVYGLDANGNVVATAGLAEIVKGENSVTLTGEGIVAVKIVMTDYPHNGNKFCNAELTVVKVSKAA